jgi:hypothetical protein
VYDGTYDSSNGERQREVLDMNWRIGYCTNVHAGNTLEETKTQLLRHAVAVRRQLDADSPLGVGLWLARSTADQMLAEKRVSEFADFLAQNGLSPYTLNGFPHGDFHREVVRHDVYLPTWRETARTDYTLQLIQILHEILPEGDEGSISTVPLGWGQPPWTEPQLVEAADQLSRVSEYLRHLEDETGRLIYVCLEPEPGCVLQRSGDLADFFEQHLFRQGPEKNRRYLRVCHDVCHAAVMFESQQDALRRYRAAGILVGKVQISSAVIVPFHQYAPEDRVTAFEELGAFAEHRYLHQTLIRRAAGHPEFHEDLPLALSMARDSAPNDNSLGTWLANQEWRIHFHVPVYLERFGRLMTSRSDILSCLDTLEGFPELSHLEVETYAWNVLPPALQHAQLADGIAAEMAWLRDILAARRAGATRSSLPELPSSPPESV